jgi:hypothetical protein
MAKKYVELDTTNGRLKQRTATDNSGGGTNAGDIVALDSGGKLDPSLFPSGVGGGGQVLSIPTSEAVAAGDWINIYNSGGVKTARKALATAADKPAHGYVVAAFGSGATASVYIGGVNNKVALGSFVVADIGSRAFLSAATSGATIKSISGFSTGNLVQALGSVVDVDASFVSVEMDFGEPILF